MDFNYSHHDFFVAVKENFPDLTMIDQGDFYEIVIKFSRPREEIITTKLQKEKIDALMEGVRKLNVEYDAILYNDKYFESILVEEGNPFKVPLLYGEKKIQVLDKDNNIRYDISILNDEYLIWLLLNTRNKLTSRRNSSLIFRRKVAELAEDSDLLDILSLWFNFKTLKIRSLAKVIIASLSGLRVQQLS